MRILVVDDQHDLRSLTAAGLERMGFDVLQAANGQEALALLIAPNNVDVLFTDVVMPEMSGVDLAHEARRKHNGLRVILTSGYAPPQTKIPKTWQFLQKPYTMPSLLTALRRAT